MAASEDTLGLLHDIVAQGLLARIKSGEATASDYTNALKMLKDNNITCIPSKDNALGKLQEELDGRSVATADDVDLQNALDQLDFNIAREA